MDLFSFCIFLDYLFDQFDYNIGWMGLLVWDIYQNFVDCDYDMKFQLGMLKSWFFENDNLDFVMMF